MARGKKTDRETIYKVMLSMFSTGNSAETAKELNLPRTTVESLYKKNQDKEEFVILRNKKNNEFVETATRIINKGTELLEKRLDIALSDIIDFGEIMNDIYNTGKEDIKEQQKKALINKIMKLQVNGLSEITTAIGTLYDKKALASGDITSNENITITVNLKD